MHDLEVTTPGPHREFRNPGISLPPGSCDAHVHVFGPHRVFPFAPERTFTPQDAPLELLRELHATMGFERSVLVQSATHGNDHSVLLDALERGEGAYRAVALLDPTTSVTEVGRLDAAGFRGARIHFAPHLGKSPSQDRIRALVDLIGPHGWHLEVHVMEDGLAEFAEVVDDIDIPVVIDHMGRVDPTPENEDPRVFLLDQLLERGGTWVKLSGADRISRRTPSMADGLAFARRLAERHPDRCVWGTDFPHPNTHGFMPWDRDLVQGIATIAPTHEERFRLLVRNPEILFGFEPTTA
ncbi:amidohydrolase [Nocardiopsis sp. L17-MgMaSL7]|uniref:amidohydrolase family protein n=1 Tax=Nocardiopsis sp. L17-MgMaSL7 TaxID=1938893 RepID=UPI000D97F1FA|nr:amidohydrolase family protein [Nocardiopsis sp. L17-MgMaSL7]PWV55373.1 putative TIM-barrel fold metal-dependent hydrolase [Nocardiopsis sp. L17-MgMaSL7]